MHVEYTISEKDYNDFHKYILLKSHRSLITVHVLFTVLLFVFCFNNNLKPSFQISLFISAVVIYCLFYFVLFYRSKRKLHKGIASEPAALERKILTVIDEGLLIESASKTTTWRWDSLKTVGANENFNFLTLADNRYVLLPKASFASGEDAVAILGLIQRKIYGFELTRFKAAIVKKQPPYLLGLIGVVPLAGAVVGLGLILYGIFKYKDKWLVLIGAAGIVWTVAIYAIFTSYSKPGNFKNQMNQAMNETAQFYLNNLVKDIEFYKVEHGAYPDNLQQIEDKNGFVPVTDPTQSSFGSKKAAYFNYKRVGDHYYLFSSGQDGIPNTADDIYPNFSAADSGKIGLIIKNSR